MLYQFSQTMYFLQVKKIKLRPAPGYRKNARDLKFVFEVYERGPGGGLVRCEAERIAQSVRLIHSDDGRWSPADEDDELLLEALGLPPRLDCGDDLKLALIGRWIEGRPGPPGPDGLNPLAEVRSTRQEAATVPISAPQRPVDLAATPADALDPADRPPGSDEFNPLAELIPIDPPKPRVMTDLPPCDSPQPLVTHRDARPLDSTRIGLVEASEFYDIPKSVLSKAAAKNPGARGYLPSIRKGRRVFFDREDIQNLSRSRKQMKHRSKRPAKVLDLTSVSRLFRRD